MLAVVLLFYFLFTQVCFSVLSDSLNCLLLFSRISVGFLKKFLSSLFHNRPLLFILVLIFIGVYNFLLPYLRKLIESYSIPFSYSLSLLLSVSDFRFLQYLHFSCGLFSLLYLSFIRCSYVFSFEHTLKICVELNFTWEFRSFYSSFYNCYRLHNLDKNVNVLVRIFKARILWQWLEYRGYRLMIIRYRNEEFGRDNREFINSDDVHAFDSQIRLLAQLSIARQVQRGEDGQLAYQLSHHVPWNIDAIYVINRENIANKAET